MLRALANAVPAGERLVTIEKSLELGLHELDELHPDVVALEAREPNAEGEGEVTMAELVQHGLRMDPSRVIVGEVLGDEILSMLNAMSQGNDGSMCTIHATSSEYTFQRIATYAIQSSERLPVEATAQLVAGSIDFVVFIGQRDLRANDGARGLRLRRPRGRRRRARRRDLQRGLPAGAGRQGRARRPDPLPGRPARVRLRPGRP